MRVRAVVFAALIFAATGCTAAKAPVTKASVPASAPGHPIVISGATRTLVGNERAYGASVGSIPGAVYQPDVVLIGGAGWSVSARRSHEGRVAVERVAGDRRAVDVQ